MPPVKRPLPSDGLRLLLILTKTLRILAVVGLPLRSEERPKAPTAYIGPEGEEELTKLDATVDYWKMKGICMR